MSISIGNGLLPGFGAATPSPIAIGLRAVVESGAHLQATAASVGREPGPAGRIDGSGNTARGVEILSRKAVTGSVDRQRRLDDAVRRPSKN